MRKTVGAALCVAVSTAAGGAMAQTLEAVQDRDLLRCGVSGGVPGFSAPDDDGDMRGIDADVCYAVAAAVLGDSSKVEFVNLTAAERFTALASGEVDVLSRNTTHTMRRDTQLGLNFTYYNYIDGQGFLVRKGLVESALDLGGATVCIQSGTTTELNLAAYFREQGMEFTPLSYDTSSQTLEGYETGACDVLTSDVSQLAGLRSEMADPEANVILPEVISKEPLGPVVRQGDDLWANIVRWTLYAMINAEELGVTSENVEQIMSDGSETFQIRMLLGMEGELGAGIGLSNEWGYNIVSQVGNYSEVFERNVSPIGLPRGVNRLWSNGGLLYAPPF